MVYSRVLGQAELFKVFESESDEWESAFNEGLVRVGDDGESVLNFSSARVDRLYDAFKEVDGFWSSASSEYRFEYEVSNRHIPSIYEPAFSRKWFGFWWEEDPYEIPF